MSDFEQWWKREHNMPAEFKLLKDSEGNYVADQVHNDHEVWQAAIASMQGEAKLSDAFIGEVIQNVAELPDRNSPDDWPEAMLVTSDELQTILLAVHEDVPAVTYPPSASAEIARLTAELEEARKVPDGYALVPIEPTKEMLDAVFINDLDWSDTFAPSENDRRLVYKAMLSAAPDAAISKIGGGE